MMEIELGTPLAVAFLLGAFHVLEPVHGRSIFNAILVGSSRSFWKVIRFGAAVTISHIFTALVLAVLALMLSQQLGHEELTFGGQLFGIVLTVGIGGTMLWKAIQQHRREHAKTLLEDDCHCSCHHVAGETEVVSFQSERQKTPSVKIEADHHHGSATLLGISGGIIPCSASIATLTLAFSSGKIALGFFAMIAFGLGLGLTLTAVGTITVMASHQLSFTNSDKYRVFMRFAPAILILLMSVISLGLLNTGNH